MLSHCQAPWRTKVQAERPRRAVRARQPDTGQKGDDNDYGDKNYVYDNPTQANIGLPAHSRIVDNGDDID